MSKRKKPSLRDQLLEPTSLALSALTRDSKDRAARLLLAIDGDLLALPTVPPERQEAFLRRIDKQVRAELELMRLRGTRAMRSRIAATISTLIRAAAAA